MTVTLETIDCGIKFDSLLKNFDSARVGPENKKPSDIPEGQNIPDSAMISKPPEPERCKSKHILSGSSNLCKQKGDQMSQENLNAQENLENIKLKFREKELPDHHFRTEIPNIIFELKLHPYDFMVYSYIKRIAGDEGECWKTIKALSEDCSMGERRLRQSLKTLSEITIDNTPLIEVIPRKRADGSYDSNIVIINPIWRENGNYFRGKKAGGNGPPKVGGTAPNAGGVLHQMQEGTAPRAVKEELSQEEPSLRRTNRSTPDFDSNSSSSFDGAEALDSPFINFIKKDKETEKFDEETKAKFEFLWEFIERNQIGHGDTKNSKPGIKKTDLKIWIEKYDALEIMDCLKRAVPADISKTYAGYVTQLLKEEVTKRDKKMKEGRDYVQKVIDKEKMNSYIEMQKTGFKIKGDKNESVSYTLPLQTLHGILENAWKLNQQNRL